MSPVQGAHGLDVFVQWAVASHKLCRAILSPIHAISPISLISPISYQPWLVQRLRGGSRVDSGWDRSRVSEGS